jgi:hypothetical protein
VLQIISTVRTSAALSQAPRQPKTRTPRYESIEVVNGGSITGRVIWMGDPPQEASLTVPVPADMSGHCGGNRKATGRLEIHPTSRGVNHAVVYLKEITQGKPMPAPGTNIATGEKAVLDQVNCAYEPHVLVVGQRTTLAIQSSDDTPHNVNARMGATQIFNLHFPKKGQRVEDPERTNVGRKTGVIELRCNVGHFWMSGSVLVVSHPYHSVTNEAGEFDLRDVPPGEYDLVCWHERWTPRILNDANGKVAEMLYGRPHTFEQNVQVRAGEKTAVTFHLSAK